MTTSDETIGKNVRTLREMMGMSQAQLAAAMTAEGLAGIYPQTVTKIERGRRSLKLIEGLGVAKVLGVEAEALFDPPATARDDQEARRAITDLHAASSAVRDAYWKLLTAETDLEHVLAARILSPDMRQTGLRALQSDGLQATLESLSPDLEEADEPSDDDLADMHAQQLIDDMRGK